MRVGIVRLPLAAALLFAWVAPGPPGAWAQTDNPLPPAPPEVQEEAPRATSPDEPAAMAPDTGAPLGEELRAEMYLITPEGADKPTGLVMITSTDAGAKFVADLQGLPPGQHGFHVHENGDCGSGATADGTKAAGMAAGEHYDPDGTKAHLGPEGHGHLGDLPFLTVQADGKGVGEAIGPRIKDAAQLKGKVLIIHAGGDNYSDQPKPLGGGGDRIACGIIQ
jgi:Cu-Zn family superoxide dismutase